jgi:hypothetical protein
MKTGLAFLFALAGLVHAVAAARCVGAQSVPAVGQDPLPDRRVEAHAVGAAPAQRSPSITHTASSHAVGGAQGASHVMEPVVPRLLQPSLKPPAAITATGPVRGGLRTAGAAFAKPPIGSGASGAVARMGPARGATAAMVGQVSPAGSRSGAASIDGSEMRRRP